MDEEEFFNRLSTLRADTSLGDIVSIRAEKDKEVIKKFNSSQRRIYNEWQNRKIENISKELTKEERIREEDFFLRMMTLQGQQRKK